MDAPTDRQILTLAGRDYRWAGSREIAMRVELGLGDVEFWRRANQIIDRPDPELALEFGPTIRRLARIRASRQRQRRAS